MYYLMPSFLNGRHFTLAVSTRSLESSSFLKKYHSIAVKDRWVRMFSVDSSNFQS